LFSNDHNDNSNSENIQQAQSKCFNYFLAPNNDNVTPQSFRTSLVKSLSDLDAFLAQEGPYDGVIAFSQGGILVATYLIQQALINPQKPLPFKCAIFSSSGIAFDPRTLESSNEESNLKPLRQLHPDVDGHALLAGFPTAHIWGRNDEHWPGTSEVMSQLCDPNLRNEFIHDEGHAIPPPRARNAVLACVKTIRRVVKMAGSGVSE
jgi:Serine hydrolase (FSH1)